MSAAAIRLIAALLALLCLPACAPVIAMIGYGNSAVQIAVQLDRIKLLGDGVSYLGSGKTITDHAVSKIVRADCKLLNVVTPDPVCVPKRDNTTLARNDRMNIAALSEELANRDTRFNGPTADAPDEAATAEPAPEQP
jgi:hypothetical protein